jgi:hypothetical protein
MVDNLNPTSQFHPYQPMDDVPQSERIATKLGSADVNESLRKLRSYAQANPGKILAGLAAVVIGLGLLRKRST